MTGFHSQKICHSFRTELYGYILINTNVIILIAKMKFIVKNPNMDLLFIRCCFLAIAAFKMDFFQTFCEFFCLKRPDACSGEGAI